MILHGGKYPNWSFDHRKKYFPLTEMPQMCLWAQKPITSRLKVNSQVSRLNCQKLTFGLDVGRALLFVRSQYGILDDGVRFHLLSHLIRETVNIGKSMLATSIASRDDAFDPSYNSKDAGSIQNLIQKDRVLTAVCLKIYC